MPTLRPWAMPSIAGSYVFVWQIALFLSLGESFSAFGGAMALAAFAGAVGGLLLGRLVGAGHGTRVAIVALVTMVASTMLQAVSVGNAPLAVLANASGALVACLYVPVLGTAIYNQAKRSPCTLRFHIATEAGWDLGGASALLVAAGLLHAGVPIGTCLLLSLLGTRASFYLLRTYFSTLEPAA